MNAPGHKVEVLDNIKLAIGALSVHGERERVNQLLDTYNVVRELINASRNIAAGHGDYVALRSVLLQIGSRL